VEKEGRTNRAETGALFNGFLLGRSKKQQIEKNG
jgi:hypothetical protein